MSDSNSGRLAYTYTEPEIWQIEQLIAGMRKRAASWEKLWGKLVIPFFGIGLVIVVAYELDLLQQSAVRPVTLAAFLAFAAGAATYGVASRMVRRQVARETFQDAGWDKKGWELTWDAAGVKHGCEAFETSLPWRSVDSIEDHGAMVLIWYDQGQLFPIPARTFGDDSARAAFLATATARIKQAKSEQNPG